MRQLLSFLSHITDDVLGILMTIEENQINGSINDTLYNFLPEQHAINFKKFSINTYKIE